MTGDDDGQRIATIGGAHGAHGLGVADGLGNIGIAAGLAIGDPGQRLPHPQLKLGAVLGEGQVKCVALSGKVGAELLGIGGQRLRIGLPVVLDLERMWAVAKIDLAQTALIDDQQQGTARGRDLAIALHSSCSPIHDQGATAVACRSSQITLFQMPAEVAGR